MGPMEKLRALFGGSNFAKEPFFNAQKAVGGIMRTFWVDFRLLVEIMDIEFSKISHK